MQATMTTSPKPLAQRLRWDDLILPWLIRLAFLGVGLLVGLYMLAPRQQRASETYFPEAFAALPNAVVSIAVDGNVSTLPVKIADTSAARNIGFNELGPAALDNQLLLFQLTRETTSRSTYAMGGVRAPLQMAVITEAGEVVAVHDVVPGTQRMSVAEPHRWLLIARNGTFDAIGIAPGAALVPESVTKVNY